MAVNVDQQQTDDAEDEAHVQEEIAVGDPGIGTRIDLEQKVEEDKANADEG